MSLELTPDGARAWQILAAARTDLTPATVADAQRQLDDLARPLLDAGGQPLREVQDAGLILARLAGTFTAPPD